MEVRIINITNDPIKTIFNAYRICYAKGGYDAIKDKSEEEMIEFIKPLMAEMHTSPLEHVNITFYIEGISRACMSQITRHRTGSFNVQSQRYCDANSFSFVIPELSYIESEHERNVVKQELKDYYERSLREYNYFVSKGLKKEDARSILPNSTTSNMLVTFDLNNFRKMYAQRACRHAQEEIREMANIMMSQVKELIPFADYKAMYCNRICYQCSNKK